MIREMLTVSALGAAAVWAATTASAEPGPSYPDDPGRYASDVPGMVYDVQLTGPCTNMERFTFGRREAKVMATVHKCQMESGQALVGGTDRKFLSADAQLQVTLSGSAQ